MRITLLCCVALLSALAPVLPAEEIPPTEEPTADHTPEIVVNDQTARPWCYWYWLGCSVPEQDLRDNLTGLRKAGLGGVHLIPYYGIQGREDRDLPWFSPDWLSLLQASLDQCQKLGLGFDMTPGTGWPFGGPATTDSDASQRVELVQGNPTTTAFSEWRKSLPGKLVGLACYDADGQSLVTLDDSRLSDDFSFPAAARSAVALVSHPTGQMVKRAAPGAEGRVIDYFNSDAVLRYMDFFEHAFKTSGIEPGAIRAFYNDSFETYGANWTGNFLAAFQARRGYDLLPWLATLAATDQNDTRRRLISDYCETLADLQLDWVSAWTRRCHEMGLLVRNEAHGAPGNISDLYAAVDIPETEGFGVTEFTIPGLHYNSDYPGENGRPNPYIYKFASSAAHIKGTPLVSSETFTWLFEHFQETLSGMKPELDQYFLGGINHVFFIGSSVSPSDASFPGWQHYFTCDFGRFSSVWNALPAFCDYIQNCQRLFQSATADNDLLLYHPIHDFWYSEAPNDRAYLFTVHAASHWLFPQSLGQTMQNLTEQGYSWDVVSDRMIQERIDVSGQNLIARPDHDPGRNSARTVESWQTVLVPECHFMPLPTLRKLLALARGGATVIFVNDMPQDVPGMADLENRRHELQALRNELATLPGVVVTQNLTATLAEKNICRESLSEQGLSFIRYQKGSQPLYFISNLSNRFQEGSVDLAKGVGPWILYDPLANTRRQASQDLNGRIRLQLEPGRSCFLISDSQASDLTPEVPVVEDHEHEIPLSGTWRLEAVEGGPVLPPPATWTGTQLESWTSLGDDWLRFAGTARYSLDFPLSANDLSAAKQFRLILPDVRERVHVRINGHDLGLLWCLPWKIDIPSNVLAEQNHLELAVTNAWFNRVIDLDQRQIPWRIMKDTNVVNVHYQPFDAAAAAPLPSGLIGQVLIVPCVSE